MPNSEDVELLQQLIRHGGTQAFSLVPAALKNVLTERQWVGRKDKHGKVFGSFEAFATHPLTQGLETTLDDLRVHCRKHPEVYKLLLAEIEPGRSDGGDRRSKDFQIDNIKLKTKGGTSALYTLKRLKRDRPDLFQVVLGGGMSANAAAIEAGFRKQPPPFDQILKLLPKLSTAELESIVAKCNARLKDEAA
jgi:hypothetical protein